MPRDVRGAGRAALEAGLERLILGGRDAAGLLLVVDYAESRQDEVVWLAERLVRRAETNTRPARLVLLSRGSGVWWRELVLRNQSLQDLCSLGGDAYDEITIPEEITRRDRRALFDASVAAFGSYRGGSVEPRSEPRPPSADLIRALETEDDYDRPLAVQIAALLHVAGVDVEKGSSGIADLLGKILGLEYAHWNSALNIGDRPNWRTAIKNGVALTTLVGGVDSAQAAEELIGRDPLYARARDVDVPRVRHALALEFPGENDGLLALEPDLIGEHHVLTVITDALVDACLAWAGEDGVRRRHVLTVLNRATRAEHGPEASRAEAQLRRLVHAHAATLGGGLITVALETPGKLLDLIPAMEAQLDALGDPALAGIDDALPLQSLALMELSLAVARRRAALARELEPATNVSPDVEPDVREQILSFVAGRVGTLGVRLSNLGRHEEALRASQEAVEIYRRLAQTRPEAFLPALAMSLNNLGAMLANLGRREEALRASQEAVETCRRLAQTRPDAFLPALATSLGALSSTLAAAEQHAEAAEAAHEGLTAIVTLVEQHPQAFRDLARALGRGYLAACTDAGIEPDQQLLERVGRAISIDEDATIEALRQRIGAILEAAEQTGTLDEARLAELPPEIAQRLRQAWAERSDRGPG